MANSSSKPCKISDHDRNTRELQEVKSKLIMVQDHTHEVTKNYHWKKKLGAEAMWDAATETGDIACAVLVLSTKTKDLSHAAIQLSKSPHFNPNHVQQ